MIFKDKKEDYVFNLEQLKKYIKISFEEEEKIRKIIKIHPMKIPKYYLSLINKQNEKDTIKKMIIPCKEELNLLGDYDTSGEKENTKTVGLQHKYSNTALILSTNRCFGYCRFCFRKRLVGLSNKEILKRFEDAINYIKNHKEINNVLVSGGDSLTLDLKVLKKLLGELIKINHLDFIRIGTRAPVTFPRRILDKNLLNLFKKCSSKKQIYIVTHFNHPNEITNLSKQAISELLKCKLIINNQTVLLKGVNDHPLILSTLMKKLSRIGVNPYYVFQCRPVKRVKHHFQIPLKEGYSIIEKAKEKLDGHSKRFKYVMSHKTGKIEIIGILNNEMYFKYHQAKNLKDSGRFFKLKIKKDAGWLDNLH